MSSLTRRIDAHILTHLQHRPLTRLTRLLYWLRRRNLCWHLTETGRVVRLDVSLNTGVERASGRNYYRRGEN